MGKNRSPSARWSREHGGANSKLRNAGRVKISYATKSAADDEALLMDLRFGVPLSAYPCRWGSDYRDGETAPLHWHVGRTPEHQQAAGLTT